MGKTSNSPRLASCQEVLAVTSQSVVLVFGRRLMHASKYPNTTSCCGQDYDPTVETAINIELATMVQLHGLVGKEIF